MLKKYTNEASLFFFFAHSIISVADDVEQRWKTNDFTQFGKGKVRADCKMKGEIKNCRTVHEGTLLKVTSQFLPFQPGFQVSLCQALKFTTR